MKPWPTSPTRTRTVPSRKVAVSRVKMREPPKSSPSFSELTSAVARKIIGLGVSTSSTRTSSACTEAEVNPRQPTYGVSGGGHKSAGLGIIRSRPDDPLRLVAAAAAAAAVAAAGGEVAMMRPAAPEALAFASTLVSTFVLVGPLESALRIALALIT